MYYELLKPNETVTADVYRCQLNKLNNSLLQKRPAIASNRRKVILLHDNARPHVARVVKDTLLQLEWEVLPHPAYSPDIAPSDYHLFRSMQHGLAGTRFRSAEEVPKKCENGSMIGSLPNQHRSFDTVSPCCQKDGKKL